MVKIMENPISKWMIWGYLYFWKHPYVSFQGGKNPWKQTFWSPRMKVWFRWIFLSRGPFRCFFCETYQRSLRNYDVCECILKGLDSWLSLTPQPNIPKYWWYPRKSAKVFQWETSWIATVHRGFFCWYDSCTSLCLVCKQTLKTILLSRWPNLLHSTGVLFWTN